MVVCQAMMCSCATILRNKSAGLHQGHRLLQVGFLTPLSCRRSQPLTALLDCSAPKIESASKNSDESVPPFCCNPAPLLPSLSLGNMVAAPQAPLAASVSATRPPKSGSSTPSRKERCSGCCVCVALLGLQLHRIRC